jgi:hypothetical protein
MERGMDSNKFYRFRTAVGLGVDELSDIRK